MRGDDCLCVGGRGRRRQHVRHDVDICTLESRGEIDDDMRKVRSIVQQGESNIDITIRGSE